MQPSLGLISFAHVLKIFNNWFAVYDGIMSKRRVCNQKPLEMFRRFGFYGAARP
jgi:hypothetical protein